VAQAFVAVEEALLDGLTDIASRAAATILAARTRLTGVRQKSDRSPVTAADEASEALILAELDRLLPGVPVVSEEAGGSCPPAQLGDRFLLVDPLDGTREFVAGRDEFTVNIGLVQDARPIVGVIAAPDRGTIWRAVVGQVAERLTLASGAPPAAIRARVAIRTRRRPADGPCVVTSRSHLDPATQELVDRLAPAQRMLCGSALKFCMVAEGIADIYPRLSTTSEWDVAAGHALIEAAGGGVTRPDGSPLRYGSADRLIPGFIAFGDPLALPLR